ncbi:hypothetical protein F5B19DRAFT_475045 [Rostrohypoxylon terebratum]|nr:hypothetical protein F5B19DRAFT_475045 [Rostrohypoxylon terebratum]
MTITSTKSSADGSTIGGNGKQILYNRILTFNAEYWKTVLVLSITLIIIVATVTGVLVTQIPRLITNDSSSDPEQSRQSFQSSSSAWSVSLASSPPSHRTSSSASPSFTQLSLDSTTSAKNGASPSTLISTSSTSFKSPTTTTTPTITPTTSLNGMKNLSPGQPCTNDNDCQAPNICYSDTSINQKTCCGTEIWGCPGASCSNYEDCLDPYGCVVEIGKCCGYPPYTIQVPTTCYTASKTS